MAPLMGGSGKSNHCQYDQRAKKVVSDSLGLVDFTIGLVNSVLNLPDGQWFFWRNSNWGTVINPAHQIFFRLVEMTFGLVHARYSLEFGQAVKLTFFAPWWLSHVAKLVFFMFWLVLATPFKSFINHCMQYSSQVNLKNLVINNMVLCFSYH